MVQHVSDPDTDFPNLILLTESIDSYLADNRTLSNSQMTGTTSTIYDYADAEELNQFVAVIVAKYKRR